MRRCSLESRVCVALYSLWSRVANHFHSFRSENAKHSRPRLDRSCSFRVARTCLRLGQLKNSAQALFFLTLPRGALSLLERYMFRTSLPRHFLAFRKCRVVAVPSTSSIPSREQSSLLAWADMVEHFVYDTHVSSRVANHFHSLRSENAKHSRPRLDRSCSFRVARTCLRLGQLKNSAQALFFLTLSAQRGSNPRPSP